MDTDLIISGKFLTLRDPDVMVKQVFAAVRPDFAAQVKLGDLIVAGRNFGCGSSREEAPALLKRLGIGLVIAEGFSRLFFRNSINIGLPLLECEGFPGRVLRVIWWRRIWRGVWSGILLGIRGLRRGSL